MESICCGTLGHPWGIAGLLGVRWNNDAPPCSVGDHIFVEIDGSYRAYEIVKLEKRGGKQLVGFQDIASPEVAKTLSGRSLFLPKSHFGTLPDGEYYSFQVIGLRVVTEEGEELGTIKSIFSTGANDVYEVAPAERGHESLLLPATSEVIVKIDVAEQKMIIRKMPGLFDAL